MHDDFPRNIGLRVAHVRHFTPLGGCRNAYLPLTLWRPSERAPGLVELT